MLAVCGATNPDTLDLLGSGLAPNKPGLFFEGTGTVGGGNGMAFGDGLRCAGGSISRIGLRTANASGEIHWGPSFGNPLVSTRTGAVPGDGRTYQLWYRDPSGGPCSSGFNLTNAVRVNW